MSAIAARTPKLARKELLREAILVAGKWKTSNATYKVEDPSTGQIIGQVPDCEVKEFTAAIDAAKDAFASFKKTTARHRSDLLRKWAELVRSNSDDLAKILSWENGKPHNEAHGEILSCASTFEWFSEAAPHYQGDTLLSQNANVRLSTIRQPIGVCAILSPFNFPSSMIARKVGAAIGAGCTTVIKPSAETPYSALALAFLAGEAGLPNGVMNVVTSESHIEAAGKELCSNPKVSKITFTGSTRVGKLLIHQSASTVKKISMELGGNSPFIVFGDANIDAAVEGAIASKFRGSGQTCICANRFYVHESVYDEFVEKLAVAMDKLKPGHPFDEDSTQGPLIHDRAVKKVSDHVKDALSKGGKLVRGGKRLEDIGPYFYEPTLISQGSEDMQVFSEETFGPLAAVMSFETTEEAIEHANSVEVGLAAYIYTRDISTMYQVSEALEVGMVGVNSGLISEVALPFGGVKESGFGREGSKYGLDDYTVLKTVSVNIN